MRKRFQETEGSCLALFQLILSFQLSSTLTKPMWDSMAKMVNFLYKHFHYFWREQLYSSFALNSFIWNWDQPENTHCTVEKSTNGWLVSSLTHSDSVVYFIQIAKYFPVWSNPIMFNWRPVVQWSFLLWWMFSGPNPCFLFGNVCTFTFKLFIRKGVDAFEWSYDIFCFWNSVACLLHN